MGERQAPVPVTLLTGFLGAGKTTLLNRLLRDPAFADTAVLINEFGSVGLDHLLVEAARDSVTLLAAGCLCCMVRGELADALLSLAERRAAGDLPPFRRVVIETSGLADPGPVLQTLAAHPALAGAYALDGVVTLVDAVLGAATIEAHAEARRQVAVADRIVLTKTDMVPDSAAGRSELEARLAALNPHAPLREAASATAADFSGLAASARRSGGDPSAGSTPSGHGLAYRPGGPRAAIRSVSLTTDAALPPPRLEAFLDLLQSRHGQGLLRLKGLVKTSDDPARPWVLQAVGHILHPPRRLPAWPDDDATSRLVIIVEDVAPDAIEALFAAFTGAPRLDAPDMAALTDNPLASPRGRG